MKKGISLVALVITIIVLVILTGTIIVTMMNGNIIGKSEEAVFRNNISTYQEVLSQEILKKQIETAGVLKKESLNATNNGANDDTDIKTWIPGIIDEWASKLEIQSGNLVFIGENEQEMEWAANILGESKVRYYAVTSVTGSPLDWGMWDRKDGFCLTYKKGVPLQEVFYQYKYCLQKGEKDVEPVIPQGIYTIEEVEQLQLYIQGIKSLSSITKCTDIYGDLMLSNIETLMFYLEELAQWYDGEIENKPTRVEIGDLPGFTQEIYDIVFATFDEGYRTVRLTTINDGEDEYQDFVIKNQSIIDTLLENKPGNVPFSETTVTVPSRIKYDDGTIVNVTEISDWTFYRDYQNTINNLIISEGITYYDMLNHRNINTVTLPSTITTISNLGWCNDLTVNINQNKLGSSLVSSAPWSHNNGILTVNWLDGTDVYVNGVLQ